MNDHTCLFCDRKFFGRKRKFCYSCLPPPGECDDYAKRYDDLYRACGLHPNALPPASRWTPPAHLVPKNEPERRPCVGCDAEVLAPRRWCTDRCRSRTVRHNIRSAKTPHSAALASKGYADVVRWAVRPAGRSGSSRRRTGVDPRRLAFLERCKQLPPTGRDCNVCGAPLVEWWTLRSNQKSQARCYECCMDSTSRDATKLAPSSGIVFVAIARCLHCSAEFERVGRRRNSCSEKCAQALRRERNRRKTSKRRAVNVGESYSLMDLANDSGSTCHLCGKRVDMDLSGRHPKGPTVDHLLPLSAGGADCRTNVALAHRSCNVSRGAGGTVQLRLVG